MTHNVRKRPLRSGLRKRVISLRPNIPIDPLSGERSALARFLRNTVGENEVGTVRSRGWLHKLTFFTRDYSS